MKINKASKFSDTFLDTLYGRCRFLAYKQNDQKMAYAMVFGEKPLTNHVICRIHSACITAESFLATNCDCREQLEKAMRLVSKNTGIIIHLPQEGRGNGIEAKLKQIELESTNPELDTISAFLRCGYPSDNRNYEVAVQILKDLGIESVVLYTSNPHKISALEKSGIKVDKRIDFALEIDHQHAHKNIRAKEKFFNYFKKPSE
ncbi:MAG: GTP cyclohydrolase II [Patescibacteria group bacterium]